MMLNAVAIFLPLNVRSFCETIKLIIQVSIGSEGRGILPSGITFLLMGLWNLHAPQPVHTSFTNPATLASMNFLNFKSKRASLLKAAN